MNLGKGLIKFLFVTANLIVVVLMLMSLVASTVSPDKLLIPAYTTLLLPLVIVLNIGFVLLWIIFKKWYFLLSLIAIIICFNLVRITFPVNFNRSGMSADAAGITLMTYNTLANGMMAKHTKDNPNPVIQYMLDQYPDILCIQEYSANTNENHLTKKDLLKIFNKYPYSHVEFKVNTGWSCFGTAIFSKFPIIHKQVIDYQSIYNTSIAADIQIKDKLLRVYNCHLESNNLTENDKVMAIRLKDNFDTDNIKGTTMYLSRKLGAAYRIRARQADIVAEQILASPYPVMVVGDFNDLPGSYVYTKVRGDLKDAFVERGFGLGWTFNQSIFKFRIDHILYDASLELVDFKIDNKVRHSDHYPLQCKIIL